MSYTINRLIDDADFESVDKRVRNALAERGFGVLTEIDVKEERQDCGHGGKGKMEEEKRRKEEEGRKSGEQGKK